MTVSSLARAQIRFLRVSDLAPHKITLSIILKPRAIIEVQAGMQPPAEESIY